MRLNWLLFLIGLTLSAVLVGQTIAQEGAGQKKETDKKPGQVEDKKGDKKDDKKPDQKKTDDKKSDEKGKEVKILAQGSWIAPPSPQNQGKGQEIIIRSTKDYAMIFPIPPMTNIPQDVIEKYASGIIKANLKMDKIDFDKQMVVVITTGIPFVANQKISITRAEEKDGKLVIHYLIGTQEAGQPPSTGVVGLFEKFDGKVEFIGSGKKAGVQPPGGFVPPQPPGPGATQPSPPPGAAPIPAPQPNPAAVPVPPGVPAPPPPGPVAPPKPATSPANPTPGN